MYLGSHHDTHATGSSSMKSHPLAYVGLPNPSYSCEKTVIAGDSGRRSLSADHRYRCVIRTVAFLFIHFRTRPNKRTIFIPTCAPHLLLLPRIQNNPHCILLANHARAPGAKEATPLPHSSCHWTHVLARCCFDLQFHSYNVGFISLFRKRH